MATLLAHHHPQSPLSVGKTVHMLLSLGSLTLACQQPRASRLIFFHFCSGRSPLPSLAIEAFSTVRMYQIATQLSILSTPRGVTHAIGIVFQRHQYSIRRSSLGFRPTVAAYFSVLLHSSGVFLRLVKAGFMAVARVSTQNSVFSMRLCFQNQRKACRAFKQEKGHEV